jgi:hypothetical protein
MAFKIGAQVIHLESKDQGDVFGAKQIKSATVTKVSADGVYIWLNNNHTAESAYYAAFFYPDTLECREHLQYCIDMNKRHKKEQDEYIEKTYKLVNALVRAGLK